MRLLLLALLPGLLFSHALTAGDAVSVDSPSLTTAEDQEVEWVFVGCAAFPVKPGSASEETAATGRSTSRADLAEGSALSKRDVVPSRD